MTEQSVAATQYRIRGWGGAIRIKNKGTKSCANDNIAAKTEIVRKSRDMIAISQRNNSKGGICPAKANESATLFYERTLVRYMGLEYARIKGLLAKQKETEFQTGYAVLRRGDSVKGRFVKYGARRSHNPPKRR
jgi:hypothetical protein